MARLGVFVTVGLLAAAVDASLIKLDSTNFDATIAARPTFVKFFAPWCGHCKNLAPIWAALPQVLEEQGVAVGHVDCTTPNGGSVCQRLQVRGYPTLKLFKDGNAYDAAVPRNKQSLVAFATGGFRTAQSRPFAPEPPMTVEILTDGEAAEAKAEAKAAGELDAEGEDTDNDEAEVEAEGRDGEAEEQDEAAAAPGGHDSTAAGSRFNPVLLVRELTDDTLEHDTQAATGATTGPWLVEFYAPWCPHCKSFAPKFDKIARALARDRIPITAAKIDATENPVSARRFGIRSFPSLRLLKGGRMWEYPADKPRTVADIVAFAKAGYEGLDSVAVPPPVTMWSQLQDELSQAVSEASDLIVSKPNPSMLLAAAGFVLGMLCTTVVAIGTACIVPVDAVELEPAERPQRQSVQTTPSVGSQSAQKRAAARAAATLDAARSRG